MEKAANLNLHNSIESLLRSSCIISKSAVDMGRKYDY